MYSKESKAKIGKAAYDGRFIELVDNCKIEEFSKKEFERTGKYPTSVYMVCDCPRCKRISL